MSKARKYLSGLALNLLFLHSRLSGYWLACLRELAGRGINIGVIAAPVHASAPYKHSLEGLRCFNACSQIECSAFDHLVVGGWSNSEYLNLARRFSRPTSRRILTVDQQWEGSFLQKLKLRLVRRRILDSVTHVWVPGAPHLPLARYLGFDPSRTLTGLYSCDTEKFANAGTPSSSQNPSFVFVGRLETSKGVNVLLEAYTQYRSKSPSPWELKVAGVGRLTQRVRETPGVKHLEFVQQDDLPTVLGNANAFILPSLYEPWGVVIHEAVSMGLPVICSDACGAGFHLVQNNVNGMRFEPGNANELARCMAKISNLSHQSISDFRRQSITLSKTYSIQTWADTVMMVCGAI